MIAPWQRNDAGASYSPHPKPTQAAFCWRQSSLPGPLALHEKYAIAALEFSGSFASRRLWPAKREFVPLNLVYPLPTRRGALLGRCEVEVLRVLGRVDLKGQLQSTGRGPVAAFDHQSAFGLHRLARQLH
jgi:hypothetical protein